MRERFDFDAIAYGKTDTQAVLQQDVDQLHVVFSDPRAMQYCDTLPHSDVTQTRQFVAAMMGTPFVEGEEFVVEFEGRVIGKVEF